MPPSVKITEDEWLSALRDAGAPNAPDGPEGLTQRDIVKRTGMSKAWVRTHVQMAIEEGKLMYAGKKRDIRCDGQSGLVPVYQLTGDTKQCATT